MNCKHFGTCGGCSLPGVPYAQQLKDKQARLSRLLGLDVPPLIPSPSEDRFRSKVAFVFGPEGQGRGLVMGHYARGSKQIVRVDECPVHSDRGNRIAFALRDRLMKARIYGAGAQRNGLVRHIIVRTTSDDRQAVAMLVVTRNDKALRTPVRGLLASADRPDGFYINVHDKPGPFMVGPETIKIEGHSHVKEDGIRESGVGNRDASFLISPTTFFQTNVGAAKELVKLVVDAAGKPEGLPPPNILDLYSGSGLFALPLALKGAKVTAVEENRQATKDLEANVRLNRVPEGRVRSICSRVEDALPRVRKDPWDVVILDPPRDGCSPEVLTAVFEEMQPPKAVLVSCNPEALARELPQILSAGYRASVIQPVDMFPHTEHIETVVVVQKDVVSWNRATKGVVIVSTMMAVLAELYLAVPYWSEVLPITVAASIAAVAAARWARGPALRVLLLIIYLAPAGFLIVNGNDHFSYEIMWIAPLFVLLVGDRASLEWSLPSPWRLPLAAWALIVSVSWPIVAMRELDFSPWLLGVNVSNTSVGIPPEAVLVWTAYVVLGHNIGILWIDALYRWYAPLPIARFRIDVVASLLAGVTVACLVGIYQGFVDVTFLSGHLWPHMRRAAGTLMDANTFGTIAALMGPAAVVLAIGRGGPWSMVRAGGAMALTLMGVWTSGSRTALAAILVGFAVIVYESWQRSQSRRLAPIAIAVAVVAGVVVIAGSSTMTVFTRLHSLIPGLEENTTFASAAWALWQRNGYGSVAMRMIGEHPLQGVGAGIFHPLVLDYRLLVTYVPIPPDNAQNWYRHMVAEFGLLGSLPMFVWAVLFAKTLLSRTGEGRDRFTVHVLGSTLLAIGLISLLSMSGQSMTIVLTFWTLAFWFLMVKVGGGEPSAFAPGASADKKGSSPPNAWWIAATLLVLVHSGLTYASGHGDLLPRNRAARFGWDYSGGISDLERRADGAPGRRWTSLRSMSTIPVAGQVLKFVGWIDHPDANEHPVHVRLWADGKQVYDGDLKRTDQIHLDILPQPGAKSLVLETEISRTFRPSDFGGRDRRDLGLAVQDWQWK